MESPRQARELVRSRLDGLAAPELIETVTLLLSELVTNAVIHAGSPMALTVTLDADVVRVEVSDHGSWSLPAASQSEPQNEGGRGLHLVEALASAWGWRQVADSICVWFEVGLNEE